MVRTRANNRELYFLQGENDEKRKESLDESVLLSIFIESRVNMTRYRKIYLPGVCVCVLRNA